MKLLKTLNNKICLIAFIVFIIFTFCHLIGRYPFYDEMHSYFISKLSFGEIFQLLKYEGHPFLFFLLIKPATWFSLKLYPYPMLLINWIIALCMIWFFLKKAPFDNWIKILIIFTYPFLSYFPIVARPYALTTFSIFLLCYFYKKDKPILFSLALFFAMNTTVMGMISAFAFSILFFSKLFKEKKYDKKQRITVFSIVILTIILFLAQFLGTRKPYSSNALNTHLAFLYNVVKYIFIPFLGSSHETIFKTIFKITTMIMFYSSLIFFYKKNKEALVYLIITYVLLTILFCSIYIGCFWHYIYYFINLVVAWWISANEFKQAKKYKVLSACLIIFMIFPCFMLKYGALKVLDSSQYILAKKQVLDFVLKNKDSKFFIFQNWSAAVTTIPYILDNNIKVYNKFGKEKMSFEGLYEDIKMAGINEVPSILFDALAKDKKNFVVEVNNKSYQNENYPDIRVYSFGDKEIVSFLRFKDKKSKIAIYEMVAKYREK